MPFFPLLSGFHLREFYNTYVYNYFEKSFFLQRIEVWFDFRSLIFGTWNLLSALPLTAEGQIEKVTLYQLTNSHEVIPAAEQSLYIFLSHAKLQRYHIFRINLRLAAKCTFRLGLTQIASLDPRKTIFCFGLTMRVEPLACCRMWGLSCTTQRLHD